MPLVRRVKPAIHGDSDEEESFESEVQGESRSSDGNGDGDVDGLSLSGTATDDEENSGVSNDDDERVDSVAPRRSPKANTRTRTRISSPFSTRTHARYQPASPLHTAPAQAKPARTFAAAVKHQAQQITKRHAAAAADDDDDDEAEEEEEAQISRPPHARTPAPRPHRSSPPPKRTSKSAPAVQSSKKPVPRFREAVEATVPRARDPRFDPAYGTVNERQFAKNYAFLKEYKDKEMDALRGEIEKLKRKRDNHATAPAGNNDKEEELLRKTERKLISMESQRETQESKERTAALIAEHKKRERQLVKQGKAPYFLKRSEQKKMLLMDKYLKLGEKGLDRVIERKRKRNAAKQRKNMPWARRNAA